MKNLLTALLCRLLVAAFCSSGGLLSPSWVADAAPRESDGGAGAGGGADKGKDANKTRPNEPGRDGGHFCTAWPSETAWCIMLLAAVWREQNPFYESSCWNCQPENDLATYIPR